MKRRLPLVLSIVIMLTLTNTFQVFADIVLSDTVGPRVAATYFPRPNDLNWNNSSVELYIDVVDTTSEISSISYQYSNITDPSNIITHPIVTHPAWGNSISSILYLYTEGNSVLTYWAKDTAGYESNHETLSINIDKTRPTISGGVTNQAKNGWYKDDVTVHFTATDSLSGIRSVTPDLTLSEGIDQYVTGTAIDNAGNTKSVTVAGINIDKSSPTIRETQTNGTLGDNGWYVSPVTIQFEYSDSLSGIDTYSGDKTITEEGINKSVTVYATDLAGNETSATTQNFKLDWTKPITTATISGTKGSNDWYTTDVTVTLSATDSLSGIAKTEYSLDGQVWTQGTTINVNTERTTRIYYRSKDSAGNAEEAKYIDLNIHKTAPEITIADYVKTPTNKDIIVQASTNEGTLNATSHTFTENGSFEFVATDEAGNVSKQTVTITNIDKDAPVITIAPYNAEPTNKDVVVTASTNEGTMNADSHTFTENGSFTFTATDAAGNTTNKEIVITNIDKVAPVITIAPYNTDPTNKDVVVAASTNEGVLNADSHTFTENGSFTFTATDAAGNTSIKEVVITYIDKTCPEVSTNISNNLYLQRIGEFQLTSVATDNGTGIDCFEATLDGIRIDTNATLKIEQLSFGDHVLLFEAKDMAGNKTQKEIKVFVVTSIDTINKLLDRYYLNGMIDNKGVYNSLKEQISRSDIKAFINHLNAQKGKHIDESIVNLLIDHVKNLRINQ